MRFQFSVCSFHFISVASNTPLGDSYRICAVGWRIKIWYVSQIIPMSAFSAMWEACKAVLCSRPIAASHALAYDRPIGYRARASRRRVYICRRQSDAV